MRRVKKGLSVILILTVLGACMGCASNSEGKKEEPVILHSMKVHIDLNNPYTKSIDIETVSMNDEVKSGSLGYKANRRALEKITEILRGISDPGQESENGCGEAVSLTGAGTGITGEESEQEIIEKYDNI